MGLRPTEGDEKQLPFSNYSPWKHRPPLCHPDRSEAQWRDLRFGGSPLEMFFDSEGCESPAHEPGFRRNLSNPIFSPRPHFNDPDEVT